MEVDLSDGWYIMKATLDEPLKAFVKQGKISIGDKLHICCAKVLY
jgi:hypothetical protein